MIGSRVSCFLPPPVTKIGFFVPKMKLLKPMKLYHESLKTSGPLLGLYVGKKILDFSISDTRNEVAIPLPRLLRIKKNIGSVADLPGLISLHSVSGIVIGYPSERKKSGPITRPEVQHFVEYLNKTGELEDVNYTLWEEPFKSKITDPTLKQLELDPLFVNRFASLEILQGYLDCVNSLSSSEANCAKDHSEPSHAQAKKDEGY